jgi:hypothetical protein
MPDASSQAKTDRLKAALRENLKRRKAQARGRSAPPEADPGGARGGDATPEADPGGAVEPGAEPERRSE